MLRASIAFATGLVTLFGWTALAAADKNEKEEKQSGPVKWTATFEPKSVKPGGEATLKVKASIESGWHIYAVDKPTGVSKKTALKLAAAEKLTPDKEWKIPDPVRYEKADEETYVYLDDATFTRKVKVSDSAEKAIETTVTAEFMACNEEMCLPPKKVVVKATLKVEK
jgi:Disulphide bond corrector protein DsbC.